VKESDSRHGAESSRAAVGKGSARTIWDCDLTRSSTGSGNVRRLGLVSPRGQLAGSGWTGFSSTWSHASAQNGSGERPAGGGGCACAGSPEATSHEDRAVKRHADVTEIRDNLALGSGMSDWR
jgi:hypothetical protein